MKTKTIVVIEPLKQPRVGEHMHGRVVAHPFHSFGTEIVTSPVLELLPDGFETKTYRYQLSGSCSPLHSSAR